MEVAVYCRHTVGVSGIVVVTFHDSQPSAALLPAVIHYKSTLSAAVRPVRRQRASSAAHGTHPSTEDWQWWWQW